MGKHVSIKNFHIGNFLFAMIVYLILCIFSFIFIVRIYLVIKSSLFGFRRSIKVKKTLIIILIISILYFSQAIYSFFSIIGKNKIDSWATHMYEENDNKYYIFIFIYLAITEIFPCLMIWMVFHISLKRNTSRLSSETPVINQDNNSSELESSDSNY
ncbi:tobamovirus multiplication protein 1-like isoform x1 [Anaeramoeba flamelloides]|uniref:Tobamovirus multiplication protein 1-like isoform x1 n=1 Tax=Anaeramoeba flamelloides TaxID=1746091 RepID=A0AAV8A262_9EUKA|nr:tobamovirus multiplication protein 1-like isoform x1 [Anaeramoeba flamelloides]